MPEKVIFSPKELENEEWRPIYYFDGCYEVSNLGRIKSLTRITYVCGAKRRVSGRILRFSTSGSKNEYYLADLYKMGKSYPTSVHRAVMLAFIGENKLQVDHINGNTFDNRLTNLRYVTSYQNTWNRIKKVGSGKYKGVYRTKKTDKWHAMITKEYKTMYLGTFLTEDEAAIAYNKAASDIFGEFAYLNCIGGKA